MAAARDPTVAPATGSVGFCPGGLIFGEARAFVYGCGLCHPFNVDHISVIDDNTRPLGVGFFLEHFAIVLGLSVGACPTCCLIDDHD